MTPVQLKDLDELKSRCAESPVEAFIMLNGQLRSEKVIQHFPDGFTVYGDEEDYLEDGEEAVITWEISHLIDDSYEGFRTDEEFLENTNVGHALKNNALYVWEEDS